MVQIDKLFNNILKENEKRQDFLRIMIKYKMSCDDLILYMEEIKKEEIEFKKYKISPVGERDYENKRKIK